MHHKHAGCAHLRHPICTLGLRLLTPGRPGAANVRSLRAGQHHIVAEAGVLTVRTWHHGVLLSLLMLLLLRSEARVCFAQGWKNRTLSQSRCRQVPGMRARREHAGRVVARASKEQIHTQRALSTSGFVNVDCVVRCVCGNMHSAHSKARALCCTLCLWKHAQCTEQSTRNLPGMTTKNLAFQRQRECLKKG